jgi:hypothetical protein
MVQLFARVFRQKSQHKISIPLRQGIFPPIPAASLGVSRMLRAIQLDDDTCTPGAIFPHGVDARSPGYMREQTCQRDIYAVTDEPANAGGIILFPFRFVG